MKNLKIFLWLSIIFFSSSQKVLGAPDLKEVFRGLNRVTETSLQKIWPTLDWENAEIVYFDRETKKAWLWKKGTIDLTKAEVDYFIVPAHIVNSTYGANFEQDFMGFRLFINLNDNSETHKALDLSFHEGFHFFHQNAIKHMWQVSTKEREIIFPLSGRPRYLRKLLTKKLFEAYIAEDASEMNLKLQEASFLWREWKEVAPSEVESASAIEVVEGSSMYVATKSMQYAYPEVEGFIKKYVVDTAQIDVPFFNLEVESYDLGHYASLLLDRKQIINWKDEVTKGESPLTVLLKDISPAKPAEDNGILKTLDQFLEQQNADISASLGSSLELLKKGAYIKVSISQELTHGSSASHSGRYRLTEFNNLSFTLENNIELNTDKGFYRITDVSTVEEKTNPCFEGPSINLLLTPTQFKNALIGSQLKIENDETSLNLKGRQEGQYFCADL